MPPIGTRPDICEDRDNFLALAESKERSIIEIQIGALPYIVSPFERNATPFKQRVLKQYSTLGVMRIWSSCSIVTTSNGSAQQLVW